MIKFIFSTIIIIILSNHLFDKVEPFGLDSFFFSSSRDVFASRSASSADKLQIHCEVVEVTKRE